METLKKEVTIPADHHLTLDIQLPDSIPSGDAEVLLIFQPAPKKVDAGGKKRTPGLLAGQNYYMAEDFDDPLFGALSDYAYPSKISDEKSAWESSVADA